MSAAAVVLPQVWATACEELGEAGGKIGPASIHLVYPIVEPAAPILLPPRAGRLHLVKAGAAMEGTVATAAEVVYEAVAAEPAPAPQIADYRLYTEGLLHRYLRLAMSGGRAPSLLGRELFKSNVANYKVQSFDDAVIFAHDVENCMAKLDEGHRAVLDRIALQGYEHQEAAALLGWRLRTTIRRYGEALDELTVLFLERKLLKPLESCQGVQHPLFVANH